MAWQFTINDYTSGSLVATAVQEPVGWDGVNLHLKRDEKAHGFFNFEDDTFSNMQFDGNGAVILRNAYYTYGVQAQVQLSVGYNCDGGDDDANLYIGTFDFTTFKDYTADRCYVECAVLSTQSYYLLKNRSGQAVDLDSLSSYDQLPVSQTISCKAIFQEASTMIGQSFGQIRVTQLLNGLMPGSKITISGSGSNDSTFTVASSKPDYSNVNPDLAGGGSEVSSLEVSATFDADNMTISINQLINCSAGGTITLTTAAWPSGNIHFTVYENSGTYNILSVQQFFNYTVLTVSLLSLAPLNPTNTLNNQGTPYMVSTSQDGVNITGINGASAIVFTAQPTATIITVAEAIANEAQIAITLTGQWLKNNMVPYSALSKVITVPAKVVEATSIYKQVVDTIYNLNMGNPHLAGNLGDIRGWITPEMTNIQSDIDETDVGTGVCFINPTNPYGGGYNSTNTPDTLIYFRQESLGCSGLASLKYNITYQYIPYDSGDHQNYIVGTTLQSYRAQLQFIVGPDPTNLSSSTIVAQSYIDCSTWPMSPLTVSGEVDNFVLNPGEYLWMWLQLPVQNNVDAYYPKLLIGAGSYFQVTINSQCTDTPCSVYLINEALSRCAESYTNGQIQVYSDYFGRKNAQPVASAEDGCGGLACITNGLRIRGCTMPDGSAIPKFFVSLDDALTALDAIHNIGWAIEPDPNRSGYYRLRVEPFEHWFNDTVLLTCLNVMNYSRETATSLLASSFKCGYQQFETWNNNGLYDIFGSRSYRTPLNHLTNELDKTCKWMASDYAIEFTRRQFGLTTSDSRYDGSTFILSLTNKYEADCEFASGCMLVYMPSVAFAVSANITIAGSTSNNITATVTHIEPSYITGFSYVYFASGTIVNEYAPAITITGGSISPFQTAAYFIDSNGAICLEVEDLFGAQPGDQIVVSNTAANNNTYTIKNIYAPVATSALSNTSFPMVIFPTPAVAASLPAYEANTIINDATNQFYAVEQGNMVNGTNILSPATVMNYRISPAHCAMRHYRNVITDRQYASESLIFTGGEGNFYALGMLNDSCTPENGNISEGGNLSLSNFTTPADGEPLFYPEIVKFEYPLTWAQFLVIQANPYGLIQFEHTNEGLQSGWLADLQYHPYTGMAEFQLYPKI